MDGWVDDWVDGRMGKFGRQGQQGMVRSKGMLPWRRWALVWASKDRYGLLLGKAEDGRSGRSRVDGRPD